MGVPSEKFDKALADAEDAVERLGTHLEWVVDDGRTEDQAAHALLGMNALLARLREVTDR